MSGIELVSGDRYEHGTRARYVGGKCRCAPCTKANRDYASGRAKAVANGDCNGLIDAGPARAHLLALSCAGVGKRSVQAACDVSLSVLQDVRNGTKTQIRERTARRILAVDTGAIGDHALVSAKQTKAHLRELLRLGLTQTEIAARLGSQAAVPALQLKFSHVIAINALKVSKLLAEVRAEVDWGESIEEICTTCGQSHSKERRLTWLRLHREAEARDIVEAQPCWYGDGETGQQRLFRDRRALRGEAS